MGAGSNIVRFVPHMQGEVMTLVASPSPIFAEQSFALTWEGPEWGVTTQVELVSPHPNPPHKGEGTGGASG